MNDKETLKCNRIIDAVELDRHPELLRYIKNRMDSDVGEEVMHRIRDNGEYIVRAKIEEEQFKEFSAMNITETVEITRLIRCKDCMYWDKSWQTIEGCHYCGMIDKQTEGNFFCGDGEREEE